VKSNVTVSLSSECIQALEQLGKQESIGRSAVIEMLALGQMTRPVDDEPQPMLQATEISEVLKRIPAILKRLEKLEAL
jgi:hypothetical protein